MHKMDEVRMLFYNDYINAWSALYCHFLDGAESLEGQSIEQAQDAGMEEVRKSLREQKVLKFFERKTRYRGAFKYFAPELKVAINKVDELVNTINDTYEEMSGEEFIGMFLQIIGIVRPDLKERKIVELRDYGLLPAEREK